MKTNKFMQFMATVVVFASMVFFASCEKDEPELPEVIESEVLDEGLSENIKSETTEQGTKLSYESWIMVKGQTRAAFENKVSVTLNGELKDVADTCVVGIWNFEDYQTSLTNEAGNERVDGFVTVTDSAAVYTVKFNEFSFEYRLNYEVAVYDDKVTRQVMPYLYYSNIKDNGGQFEVIDSYSDGRYTYARRVYHHSISVDFGGETYELHANIMLKREMGEGNDPFILRSKVLDKFVDFSSNENTYISSIKVSSDYSDGVTREEVFSTPLQVYSEAAEAKAIKVNGTVDDVSLQEIQIVEKDRYFEDSDTKYIRKERILEDCILNFGDFELRIPFVRYSAVFDNGVLIEEMAGCSMENRQVQITSMDWDFIENNGNEYHYYLELKVEMKIDELTVEGMYSGWLTFVH